MPERDLNLAPGENPPVTMSIDEIFAQLNAASDPLQAEAFLQMIRLDKSQVQEVLDRVAAGAELPPPVAGIFSLVGKSKDLVAEMWPGEEVFDDDAAFSLTRFVLLVDQVNGRVLSAARWAAASAQMRRLLLAGRLPSLRGLLFMVWHGFERGDDEFAVFFAANTKLDLMELGQAAFHRSDEVKHKVFQIWPQIEAERARLAREVWLSGYISAGEYQEAQGMQDSMLQALYPQVWADGYKGYAQAVASK